MIILDTNVISEPMRKKPDPNVINWLNQQTAHGLFVTTINIAELRFGIERLPEGKRKAALWAALEFTMSQLFATRILTFDLAAAEESARIAARAEATGKPIGLADGQIAAIARVHGFIIATRDTTPFENAGVEVINPWG